MIAAVEFGTDFLGVRRVARRGIEIHYGIECLAVADPLIDGCAGLFPLLGVIICAFEGRDGTANHTDAVRTGAFNHLPQPGDHVVGRRAASDVVNAFENG